MRGAPEEERITGDVPDVQIRGTGPDHDGASVPGVTDVTDDDPLLPPISVSRAWHTYFQYVMQNFE
jgi:hypothetical protein